jgi:hypothetical protein
VVAAEDLLERRRDLADRGARAGGLDRQLEQVALPALRRRRERVERRADLARVARLLDALDAGDLRLAHGAVVDLADVDRRLLLELELVDADDDVLAAVDARLAPRGRLLDAELRHARLDGLRHAAHRLDLLDDAEGLPGEGVRQRLHEVRAAPRVDDLRDAGLHLEDELRVAGDARRGVGGQRDRLVERVRVQALRAAEDRRPWPRSWCG